METTNWELVNKPCMFDEDASRDSVNQGELGNCWFLAAVTTLTQHKQLFYRVVPPDQGFDTEEYCGAFYFNFWQNGEWTQVVIDDRLPVNHGYKLVFMHSRSRDEFWSALLEKAYAKLFGSYESLMYGHSGEAMEDFTGGITVVLDLASQEPKQLYQVCSEAFQRGALMCASIDPANAERSPLGLVTGHAFSVTAVKEVPVTTHSLSGSVILFRIRNPWGEGEWKGAWSDGSSEWSSVSRDTRREIGLSFDEDGEFWMSLGDFVKHFKRLEICMLSPNSVEGDKVWEVVKYKDKWVRKLTAGGSRKNKDTFHMNPQFRVTLRDVKNDEDGDTDDKGNPLCPLTVSLMQIGRRSLKRFTDGTVNHSIGFSLYKLDEQDQRRSRLGMEYFSRHRPTAASDQFVNTRGTAKRFSLKPGVYCIVPSTFEAGQEADFLLRLFSVNVFQSRIQDEMTHFTRPVKPKLTAVSKDSVLNDNYEEFFCKITGMETYMNANQLKRVLDIAFSNDDESGITVETCRSLISMYDVTGLLELDAFKQLLVTVKLCQKATRNIFLVRGVSFEDLKDCMNKLGISMSARCLSSVTRHYADTNGVLNFNDFLQIYSKLVRFIEIFEMKKAQEPQLPSVDELIEYYVG